MNCGVVLEREPRTLRVKTRLFGRSLQTLILRSRRDGCSCAQFSHSCRELGCGSLVLVQRACLFLAVQSVQVNASRPPTGDSFMSRLKLLARKIT
jgi:hypothetical protein